VPEGAQRVGLTRSDQLAAKDIGQFAVHRDAADPQVCAVERSLLGTPSGPMVRVHGGYANRMYRLDTDQGSFAVKQMNLADRRTAYHVEEVFRFEQAAFAAGIPMPEPISAGGGTLVHRWVEGEKVPEAPVSRQYAFEVGEILARLHAPGMVGRWYSTGSFRARSTCPASSARRH